MPIFSPTYTIDILSNYDTATVPTVVDDLLQADKESNMKQIYEALETIVKFSFASRKDPKEAGKKLTDALFDLIGTHRYDFDTVTIRMLKAQVSALTEDWIRANRLWKSLGKMPGIFNSCFVFCLYNYAEVVRTERSLPTS